MARNRILLIIGGGIAAYKCLDLVRRLAERNIEVRVVMTKAAHHFVTPLSVSALTNDRVFSDLFDLNDENEIGHIRLSRETDLIVVAPATANLISRMAHGQASDLASAVLLATSKPVLVAPAMNPQMWAHPATQRNVAQIKADGAVIIEPAIGEMAEKGEAGQGRLPEVPFLIQAIEDTLRASQRKTSNDNIAHAKQTLSGRHVLITSGPTHEPIDPVRYIANRSSGKQGHALARAAAAAGARVTLVTGPVDEIYAPRNSHGIDTIKVETAIEMLDAVKSALPADIAIFAAAVADWRVENANTDKIKKKGRDKSMSLKLSENPDILKTIASKKHHRPSLVIGFAAETNDVVANANQKLKRKGADWIVANNVAPETGIMGGDANEVCLMTQSSSETWPRLPKSEVATRLISRAAAHLNENLRTNRDAAE